MVNLGAGKDTDTSSGDIPQDSERKLPNGDRWGTDTDDGWDDSFGLGGDV
ncbi:MAG: hypothetical protein ACOCQY_02740 [Halorhabdus sp.]